MASVNHLHLHLLHIDVDLYIDRAKLELLDDNETFRLGRDMPTEAICFVVDKNRSCLNASIDKTFNFIQWLCEQNIPHNIFLTLDRTNNGLIKLFIFAREKHLVVKDLFELNAAFCELSGFIPIGDKNLYDRISEEEIINKIRAETGSVFQQIYSYFKNV